MSRVYESRGFGSASSFLAAARNTALIQDLDARAADLEGYLFPETYALTRSTTVERLVRSMVDRFRATYTEPLQQSARDQQLTIRQVVTLASVIAGGVVALVGGILGLRGSGEPEVAGLTSPAAPHAVATARERRAPAILRPGCSGTGRRPPGLR